MRSRYSPALLGLAAALAALAPTAQAQHRSAQDAVDLAAGHFRSYATGLAAGDLADLAATDAYPDALTGRSYVYLAQRVHGIDVVNATAVAAVDADGNVYGATQQFRTGLAARANSATPAMGATDAIQAAARRLGIDGLGLLVMTRQDATRPGAAVYTVAGTDVEIPVRLVYFATEAGAVRLAWEVTIPQATPRRVVDDGVFVAGETHLWHARVDAATGALLDVGDLVDHDAWGRPQAAPASLAPLAANTAAPLAAAPAMAGSYRVVPMPNESPNHGAFALVTNPANATASPQGWHSDGTNSYTITRGNNAYAYDDRANLDVPGTSPDGGAGLVFDFPFDAAQQPQPNLNAAITSLFYWNNIVHDVMYQYGFTEAAGNIQQNNFGNGGLGNDYVQAEAQDGSGTDNANFGTPADGGRPRMQMYEWSAAADFEVTAPPSIAGFYEVGHPSGWGPETFNFSAEMVAAHATQDLTDVSQGCPGYTFTNQAAFAGKWAIVYRGTCGFSQKARTLQQAGAAGVVIYNCAGPEDPGCTGSNPGEAVLNMALGTGEPNDITIPVVFVGISTGQTFVATAGATARSTNLGIRRDSDLDAGVIAHEYTHGISNRLVGGPSNASCLNNAEQMGEGWSDYVGLMLTMRAGDTGPQARGVGTYLSFQGTNGSGIRPTAYSTNFAVNPSTYADIGTTYTAVHDVGYVWASMLWEMTWELIDDYGFSPDIYDASGTAGNQIALRLVTEGLKLTPCSPGFVGGRNGILAADQALYGGAHALQIWTAFARRGLGANANQGSSGSVSDGTPDFTIPPGVATEPGAGATAAVVTAPRPNPAVGASELTVSVPQPEAVRVEVYDALGRRVATAFDGPMAAGVATRVPLELSGVAPGVYVWRVTGESFAQSGRLTIAH